MAQPCSVDMLQLSAIDQEYFVKNKIRCFKRGTLEQPLVHSFDDPRLSPELIEALKRFEFPTPTPIQAISISTIMDQQDFVGISKTGSGKTLAFLIPIIKKLKDMAHLTVSQDGPVRPYCLILTPTRELAQQIHQVIVELDLIKSICLYGGSPNKHSQVSCLMKDRPPIIVGCPGRVMDIMRDYAIEFKTLRYLVLDEADRMLDMGFKSQLEEIINTTSPQRQTLLFSATFAENVRKISLNYMDKERIEVSVDDMDKRGNEDITQRIFVASFEERKTLLRETFKNFAGYKILVFCNKKSTCEALVYLAKNFGFTAEAFHGDKVQHERDRLIREFSSGLIRCLFATDALSRGIDIPDINLVINIDFPSGGVNQYVHRIGRTGRAGQKGLAYLFMCHSDIKANPMAMRDLIRLLRETKNQIPAELSTVCSRT